MRRSDDRLVDTSISSSANSFSVAAGAVLNAQVLTPPNFMTAGAHELIHLMLANCVVFPGDTSGSLKIWAVGVQIPTGSVFTEFQMYSAVTLPQTLPLSTSVGIGFSSVFSDWEFAQTDLGGTGQFSMFVQVENTDPVAAHTLTVGAKLVALIRHYPILG